MCGGVEFRKKKPLEGGLGLIEDEEVIRVLFPNPKAALLVDEGVWAPWGRRAEQAGDWPEGGWARAENLDKAFWTRWEPAPALVRPARWMEKDERGRSHWFELEPGRALRCLRLTKAPGAPLYVVTAPAPASLVHIHPRVPEIVVA